MASVHLWLHHRWGQGQKDPQGSLAASLSPGSVTGPVLKEYGGVIGVEDVLCLVVSNIKSALVSVL